MVLHFDIFRTEFSPASPFVDDFRTFVDSIGTVQNQNLVLFFQAELAFAVFTMVRWGVANNFPSDSRVQSGVFTSPNMFW